MNMNKRFLSLTLAFLMVLGSLASLAPVLAAETAADFTDVKETDWFFADVNKAVKNGLVKGYEEDNTFRPNNNLKRAEMATILARGYNLEEEASLDQFTDVKSTDWYHSAMARAVEAGIFKGDGNKLMPEQDIRRDHAFATVARAMGLEKAEDFDKTFPDADKLDKSVMGEVAALINLGFVEGDETGKLNPVANITRAEMTKIVNLALAHEAEEDKELSVKSVKAVNLTTVEVEFSGAVDKADAKSFSIDGANVVSATLSEDKTSVKLDVTGLNYGTDYTVEVKGIVVDGEAVADMSAKFTTPEVATLWNLDVVAKDGSIEADGTDNTTITFQLVDQVTGEVDKNANDIVLDLNTTYGSLAQQRATIQNGEVTVVLRSEFIAKGATAKVTAQIIEASDDYKDLIGKVSGTTNVVLAAPGSAEVDATYLTSANTNEADRVTLTFDKKVKLSDFIQTDANGNLKNALQSAEGGNGNKVVVTQAGKELAVKGFLKGSTENSLIAVLDVNRNTGTNILTDNSDVKVEVEMQNTAKKMTESDQEFKFTDARLPQVTSVNAVGMNKLVVKFSEPIAKADFMIDGKYDTKGFETVYGKFFFDNDAKLFVDERNVVELKLNEDYKEVENLAGYFKAGKHALQISSIYDFAALTDVNNIGSTQNLEFTVAENKDLAKVEVKVDSPNQYRIAFDKDATLEGVTADKKSLNNDVIELQVYNEDSKQWVNAEGYSEYANAGKLDLTIEKIKGDTAVEQYKIEVNNDWTAVYDTEDTKDNYYNDKYRVVIKKGQLKTDVNGRTNSSDIELSLNYKDSAMNTPDTMSPVISKIEETSVRGEYKVTMNEPVQDLNNRIDNDAEVGSVEFLGKDKDGKVRTFKGDAGSFTDHGLDTKFYVTANDFAAIEKVISEGGSEDWTLVLKDVTDDVGNKAATVTKDFKILVEQKASEFRVDQDANKDYKVTGRINGSVETITVEFTDKVALTGKGSAISTANFALNGSDLPTGTSIKLVENSDKAIVITVREGTLMRGSNVLTLGRNLESKEGKALVGEIEFTFNTIEGEEPTPPVEEETDQEIADKVINLITALPAVEEVNLENEDAILAARAAFDLLTVEQKALVTNVADLNAAEDKIAELKGEVKTIPGTFKQMGPAGTIVTIELEDSTLLEQVRIGETVIVAEDYDVEGNDLKVYKTPEFADADEIFVTIDGVEYRVVE